MFFKRVILWLMLLMTGVIAEASSLTWQNSALIPLVQFFNQSRLPQSAWPRIYLVQKSELPIPYDFLLTQPVMTLGIAHYYQRTPKVRPPLYILEDAKQHSYSRGIIMIVDKNAQRDDASRADQLQQSTVVELGLININTEVLPAGFLDEIKQSRTPFGALLAKYQVKTHDTHQYFFKIQCNKLLRQNLGCRCRQMLYGRTNTLANEQNIRVADVVEILTGVSKSVF
jgi:hypothetical protein